MRTYEKIKKYMDDNGIKQVYVSEKTGIPENTLSIILNGKRKLYADELISIILALGIDPSYFIDSQNEN